MLQQTAAGQQAKKATGSDQGGPHREDKWQHLLPTTFNLHSPEIRRYQGEQCVDEWRMTQTATPPRDDSDPDENQADPDKRITLPGKTDSQMSSGPHMNLDATYDGSYDNEAGQTGFKPPLYLECGPLLRFTGIYGQAGREVWRGSIMILTCDSKSSYEVPPTLLLFKPPVDLLPPSPVQTDTTGNQQVAPQCVDMIADQIKISREGKTLYVKPVETLKAKHDLSCIEDNGLFTDKKRVPPNGSTTNDQAGTRSSFSRLCSERKDRENIDRVCEISGTCLHAERGVTFWKFNLEIELGSHEAQIGYRINLAPTICFWVPARGQTMNIMFHTCNGFSLSVNPDIYSGPDPLWRDVLNAHQARPFHVMIGGGDQIYNDKCTVETHYFKEWLETDSHRKHSMPFSPQMQEELEQFFLNRYAMWFSQGLFGMSNSKIPMVNIWDDHDIIDGYGSYPHHTMTSSVFEGLGAVAFKYYMLFQHQSVPEETEKEERSWLLGVRPGPYIEQLSRSVFMFLGHRVAFLGLDCRMERTQEEILRESTWDLVFKRCRKEIVKGETKHLIVLLGVPIAYPRLNFFENILTSKAIEPLKKLTQSRMLSKFANKFDGGIEILDDLDDHWTAKHHKKERNWFIRELQELAAEKSVRITILGGDVHLAAIGQFYSNKKLGIAKDRDHRYMPNVISSAIVNRPPANILANLINQRNKVHHLDKETDEDMASIFKHDVDGKPRHNTHLLPRRNWCSIREHYSGTSPATLTLKLPSESTAVGYGSIEVHKTPRPIPALPLGTGSSGTQKRIRRFSRSDERDGYVDLATGLDVRLHIENRRGDPAGTTTAYQLLVPTLDYCGPGNENKVILTERISLFFERLIERGQRSLGFKWADSAGSPSKSRNQ